jgi:hypothetical protein
MEPLVLSDKSVTPTDELIFSIIGKNQEHWKKIMQTIHEKYPEAQGQWNYYNDGKNWLYKMSRNKKTIFWIALHKDTFRITFYFGDKAEPIIEKRKYYESNMKEVLDILADGEARGKKAAQETMSEVHDKMKFG